MKDAKTYLREFDKEIEEAGERLKEKYAEKLRSDSAELKWAYSIDEEDGIMERLASSRDNLSSVDEPLVKMLKFWTNDRRCYPKEWVEYLLSKVINDKQKYEELKCEI